MRPIILASLMLMGIALGTSQSAIAQNSALPYDPYKWCAVYGYGRSGGVSNCGFKTLEQCRLTVSGIGGTCEINTFYNPGKSSRKRAHR
jgi:hypothetical protein